MDEFVENELLPALQRYSPNNVYNGDETALYYKALPHRTYCQKESNPSGSSKKRDRLTALLITNMDGSDRRKLSVIGKAAEPRCIKKTYRMQVKDMAVDWYSSKNAWMTGVIHDKIMSKFNNDMKKSNRKVLYVCDNASSHGTRDDKEFSNIEFLRLPPNCTAVLQPLDMGIIMSLKRRYKKRLAERYLSVLDEGKDAHQLLKTLDVVQGTNMLASAWRNMPTSIIQNCFRKAGFKHHDMAEEPVPVPEEEERPAPPPHVWNRVQRWMGDVDFDEYCNQEPREDPEDAVEYTNSQIVDIVRTENIADPESSDEEEEVIPTTSKAIKNSAEFLALVEQQKAFLRRNDLTTEFLERVESDVISMQINLRKNQTPIESYFKRQVNKGTTVIPASDTTVLSAGSQTPGRDDEVVVVTDVTSTPTPVPPITELPATNSTDDAGNFVMSFDLVDSLDFDDEDCNTTIASSAVAALLKDNILPGGSSTPKRKKPDTTHKPKESQQPRTKIFKAAVAKEMLLAMSSDVSSFSDSESLFSQE